MFKNVAILFLALPALLASSAEARGCGSLNEAALNLIKQSEGFVPAPYADPVGYPTVGYGHLCADKTCSDVTKAGYKLPLTVATGTQLLASDIHRYTTCLGDYLGTNVKLNANQWGALISWTFNVGCGNAQTSTLVKRLNAGENPNTVAAEELPKWNKAGGKVLPGLANRRAAEVTLFKTATAATGYPTC